MELIGPIQIMKLFDAADIPPARLFQVFLVDAAAGSHLREVRRGRLLTST